VKHIIGEGQLTWPRAERVCDRYGAVYLVKDANPASTDSEDNTPLETTDLVGKRGTLVAHVTEVRESGHIGDLFHGVFPGGAKLGEDILLGMGKLFTEVLPGVGKVVGVKPRDSIKTMWMDIHALYRAHQQTVQLYFETED
jgi:hypothetical protein